MTQSGGLMLESLVIFLIGMGFSLVTIGLLGGLIPDTTRYPKHSADWLGWLVALGLVLVTVLAGGVLVYALQDLTATPGE